MLIIAIISSILLACIFTLHCTQHFKLQICRLRIPKKPIGIASNSVNRYFRHNNTKNTIRSKLNLSNLKNRRKCAVVAVEEFNHFPMSFLIYILFTICLCILILADEILKYYHTNTMNNLLFQPKVSINNLEPKTNHISDVSECILYYLLIYGVMLMSLSETFFAFYRFFTAHKTTTSLLNITSIIIVKRFSIYTIIFIILYVATIHFSIWLCPINLLLSLGFNLFCNYQFGTLLIATYKVYHDTDPDALNVEMLNRIYFMKRVSLICTVIQFIYFAASIFTQNTTIIGYMPILWSINTFIYSLNFVRNKKAIQNIFRCQKIAGDSKKCLESKIISLINLNAEAPAVLTRAKTAGAGIQITDMLDAKSSIVDEAPINEGAESNPHYNFKKSRSQPILQLVNETESVTTPLVESPDSIQLAVAAIKETVSLTNVYRRPAVASLKNHVSAPTVNVYNENDTVFIAGNYETESDNKCNTDTTSMLSSNGDECNDENIKCKLNLTDVSCDATHYRNAVTAQSIGEWVKYGFYTKTEINRMTLKNSKRMRFRCSAPLSPNA